MPTEPKPSTRAGCYGKV